MSWEDRGLARMVEGRNAPFRLTRQVHFVAIGGIGMGGIAEVLLQLGFAISGSDMHSSPMTERLRELGATVHIGHGADQVGDADVVVYSSAVPASNPELVRARERNIPTIRRAEMLAELMRLKHGIAVGGSHGKTTTSSLVATVLSLGGLDPTVIVGGRLLSVGGSTAMLGRGAWMVAEADESDGTFLRLSPTIAVVTNVDREHLDHYRDMDAVRQAFVDFMDRVPFYGQVIACADDPELSRLLPKVRWPVLRYGTTEDCDLRMEILASHGNGTELRFHRDGASLGECAIPLFGRHNALNATAAVAVGLELGLDFSAIGAALSSFGGVGRRLEQIGCVDDILVVDDYGHHPTELAAVLHALRSNFPERRLVVIFQPHRFTRTRDHHAEFSEVLARADQVGLLPIYAASEDPIVGISSDMILRRLKEEYKTAVHSLVDHEDACRWAREQAQPGDLWLVQGAGAIGKLARPLFAALEARAAEADQEDKA